METLEINSIDDVRCFLFYLISCKGLGAAFHPDTPIQDYDKPDGEPVFWNGVMTKQVQLDKCFKVCKDLHYDIYEEGLKILQSLSFAPRPDVPEMEIGACTITWTGQKWTCTDENGRVSAWREFEEAVMYALED